MSLQYLYPSVLGVVALVVHIGALVALTSFRARPRRGNLARRFESLVMLVGAASTVVVAGSMAVLDLTLSTTDLRGEAEAFLVVLAAGLLVALVCWMRLLRSGQR